jgi:peptide deformylase
MILPIYLFGTPVLRQPTQDVAGDSEAVQKLVDDMLETMHEASGIGLAAPQVGRNERIFVVDIGPVAAEYESGDEDLPEQPMVFINARIEDESEQVGSYEEGCLSIPDVHEEVVRPRAIRIRYLDRDFEEREAEFEGMLARVIQHEYDHVDGVLFVDHLTAFKRRLLRRRLKDISEGSVDVDYPTYAEGKGVLAP